MSFVIGNRYYDVKKLWKLTDNHPTQSMNVGLLQECLSTTSWKIVRDEIIIESSPLDILHGIVSDAHHLKRIDEANLLYPIIVISKSDLGDLAEESDPLFLVIDGLHRLCKCLKMGLSQIPVRTIDRLTFERSFLFETEEPVTPSMFC